ncbi:MAG: LysM peptidoglycan-binding domain-containing protein [Planctomycetota bacterium]|nr:LysM peptidoglycan-binding domain-containing protein [Planctomycetota bacterium]
MTRESKLALVLGFGLLLFSGILVSDHLSARQRGDAANLADANESRITRPTTEPSTIEPIAAVVTTVATLPRSPSAVTPGITVMNGTPTGITTQFPIDPTGMTAGNPTPMSSDRLYSIQQGETIAAICRREYGDSKLLHKLLDYNKSIIKDPKRIRTGLTIRIPSASVLRGEQQVASNAPMMPTAPTTVTTTTGVRSYTVQPGDIPGRIAQTQLGSAKHTKALMEANPGIDANRLKPGMVIKIPNIG